MTGSFSAPSQFRCSLGYKRIFPATLQPDFTFIYNIDCSSLLISVLRGFASFKLISSLVLLALLSLMSPKSTSKKRLPKAFLDVPLRLAGQTCLLCSKRIAEEPAHRCGYKYYRN